MEAYIRATLFDASREWKKPEVKFLESRVQIFHSGVPEEVKYV